jgi:hypothetical protein
VRVGRLLTLGAAAAFLAVLFPDWREVVVRGGPVDVVSGSSGWADLGWIAGLFALVLLLKEGRRLIRGLGATVASALRAAALAIGMLAFAVVTFATGSADVSVPTGAAADPETVLWPAYAGLFLSTLATAGALIGLAGTVRGATPPRATRGGSQRTEEPRPGATSG